MAGIIPETRVNMGDKLKDLFSKPGDAKDAEVLGDWRETPPDFITFVTSPDFLGQPPLSTRQAWALERILGEDPEASFSNTELPTESVLCWGKGSGKDVVSSYLISYVTYLVLCLRRPHEYFGLANDEPIDIINVASNANQAREVFFSKLRSRLKRPCFARFKPKLTKQEVAFEHINLHLRSLHSQNESWEGMNVLAWVMDEASAFRTVGGADNADLVYSTLRTSAQSRFPWRRWIGVVISFPRKQEGDFTLAKWKQAENNPKVFADRAATWEVNPMYDAEHPMFRDFKWVTLDELNVRVPEPFAQEFLDDPITSQTKYMAEPPPTEGAFFEYPAAITEAVDKTLPRIVTNLTTREELLPEGHRRIYVRHELISLPPKQDDCIYYLHGDPGLNSDSFSIALAHTTPETKVIVETGGKHMLVHNMVVDFLLTWEPKHTRPVDLLNVDEVLIEICEYYNVRRITFDRFNSANSIQKLISRGFNAEDLSFSNPQQFSMYRHLKLLLYNNMLKLPVDDALQNELKFIKAKNEKIEHDVYGKDRADAVAAVCWIATGQGVSTKAELVRKTLEQSRSPARGGRGNPSYAVVSNMRIR